MFGFGRDKAKAEARKRAVQSVADHLEGLKKTTSDVPFGFWNDDYVLGYFFISVARAARSAFEAEVPPGLLGEILYDVLGEASGHGAEAVQKRIDSLSAQNNRDFVNGVEAADRVTTIARGRHAFDKDPVVTIARDTLAADKGLRRPEPGNPSNAEIASWLRMMTFDDVVYVRLMSPADDAPFSRSWSQSRQPRLSRR